MPLNFRKPIVEETLQSVVARLLDLFPPASHARILKSILGAAHNAVAADFPHGLDRLCPILGLDVESAIERHTLLPLYRPFITPRALNSALKCMRGDRSPHFTLGVVQKGPCISRRLRRCPKCTIADVARLGVPIWRRLHQVVPVNLCASHCVALEETNAPSRGIFSFKFTSAAKAKTVLSPRLDRRVHPTTDWMAQAMQRIVLIPDCPQPGPERLADYYHARLRDRGFVMPNGRIAHADLMHEFIAAVSEPLLAELKCSVDVNACDNWVRRIAKSNSGHQPPYRHLLMMRFLGDEPVTALRAAMSAQRFAQTALLRQQFKAPSHSVLCAKRAKWHRAIKSGVTDLRVRHDALYSWLWRHDRAWLLSHRQLLRPSRRHAPDWLTIDRQLMRRVMVAVEDLHREGRRLSRTQLALASGSPSLVAARHKMLPRTQAVVDRLAESAESHAISRIRKVIANQRQKLDPAKPWQIAKQAGLGPGMLARPAIRNLLRPAFQT